MAETLVKEAEGKAAEAVKRAELESQARMAEIDQEIKKEETRLTSVRNSTANYVDKLKELYTQQLEYIGTLADLNNVSGAIPVVDPVREIEDKVTKMLSAASVEAAPVASEPPVQEQSDTVVFNRIQFGKDYQFE